MKILGETIPVSEDYREIDTLRFLKDNPRVYAVTHAEAGFEDLTAEEQQNVILAKLREEPSVKNLIGDVQRHGGLIEPILVRVDTNEVIEGNSRLAVYNILRDRPAAGDWEMIPCYLVSSLTDAQQAAFLSQVHVKGKTQWTPYEKANFAYVRKVGGWTLARIAEMFGESPETIRKRVAVIELMKESGDGNKKHFSHYDVLVRTPAIWQVARNAGEFRDRVVEEIKNLGSVSEEEQDITAQDLRKKLPEVLRKRKVLRRYVAGEIELEEAHQRARVSKAEERVKAALPLVEEIERKDVEGLERNAVNSLKQAIRRLTRAVDRIRTMAGMGDGK